MGKTRKKSAVNKKNAVRFKVVHRSQADPPSEDSTSTPYVLQLHATRGGKLTEGQARILASVPQDVLQGTESGTAEILEDDDEHKLEQSTLPHDYDYSRHLRSMGAAGAVYVSGRDADLVLQDARNAQMASQEPEDKEETEAERIGQERWVDSGLQGLSLGEDAKVGDDGPVDDLLETLHSDEENAWEELNDDFVAHAMTEAGVEDDEDSDEGDDGDEDDDDDDDDDEWPGDSFMGMSQAEWHALDEEEREAQKLRLLDHHFDALLGQYGEDEIGELDQDDPQVRGHVSDLRQYGQILEQCVPRDPSKSEADLTEELRAHIRKRLESMEEEPEEDADEAIEAMFQVRQTDTWDVETIRSTYTNTENHPRLIRAPRRDPKKEIKVSARTGIPLGVLDGSRTTDRDQQGAAEEEEEEQEQDSPAPRNLGSARNPSETKEEKKARKKAVKEARRKQRQHRKELSMRASAELARERAVADATAALRTIKL